MMVSCALGPALSNTRETGSRRTARSSGAGSHEALEQNWVDGIFRRDNELGTGSLLVRFSRDDIEAMTSSERWRSSDAQANTHPRHVPSELCAAWVGTMQPPHGDPEACRAGLVPARL